ncbi:Plexin-A4 [Geodia barretti]|uniref:Plexin-A4 n=1 Tax=Geodia barretti TaxID=519541 RepID=A0AA35S1Q4_GEOBA|nr:Plexin-A4 [Geodia barretti]
MGEVDIQLTTANIPEDVSYECCYGFQSGTSEQHSTTSTVTMVIPATRNNDMFTCRVRYDNVPKIPTNRDSLQSMLSLRYKENNVAVLDDPIRFANCSVHTNCTSCIDSDSQCNWCPFTFKCISSINDSCSGVDETVMESCPKLLPPLDNDNYVVHVDYTYGETPLVIRAENLGQFSDSFSSNRFNCVIKNGSEVLFKTDAVLNTDGNVECVETRFDYTLADGMASLEARLAVEWIDNDVSIDNPDRTGVTLYTCGGLGTNCAQCLSIPSIFDCEYCKSTSPLSCLLGDRCNDVIDDLGDCELPQIISVSPSSGPTEGGTVVTVRGTNLAITRSQIRNVTIAGAECAIIDDSYRPGIEFQCRTGRSVGGKGSYQVEIEFGYLTMIRRGSAFTYEVPTLDSLSPVRGPQAGKTMVTITGYNLNIGTNLRVTLFGQKCYEKAKAVDEITCLSGASDVIGRGVVSVAIDNWSGKFGDGTEYEYVKDPTVASISPRFSFAAGGTEYVVLGQDFDIIQEPRLLIHITTSNDQSGNRRKRRQTVDIFKSKPCTTDSGGTRMMCQAPPIDPALFSTRQLLAVLGLELDGVDSLLRLDNYTVTLHSNPSFQNFGKQSFSNTDNIRLTIDSQGGRFEFTEEMVEVLITPCSREECVCEDVTFQPGNSSLTCLVGTTNGLRRGSTLTVTAHIGSYNQTVGSIDITGPINPVVFIVPIVVTFLIIVVVIVVILLVVCYRGRQKDSRYKELIVEMEKLESTVARECKLGFAELQTDLDELTGDLSGHRLPYRDLKVYLLSALFPGYKDHAVLHPVQLPIQRQISSQKAIKDFHDLCMDKKVCRRLLSSLSCSGHV